jgi:hypothetical protein
MYHTNKPHPMRLLIGMLAACLIVIVAGAELNVIGGKDAVIIGMPESQGSAPLNISSYPFNNIIKDPAINYRDPSQYTAPPTKKPDYDRDDEDNETSPETSSLSNRSNATIRFEMTGSSYGKGGCYEWRSIDDVAGVSLKQTSSSRSGTYNRSNILILLNDRNYSDLSMTYITSENHVEYSGLPYRERNVFINGKDSIKTYNLADQILVDSFYFGGWDKITTDYETTNNNVTIFKIDTGYVGTFGYDAYLNDTLMISEEYIGNIVFHNNIEKHESNKTSLIEGGWLNFSERFINENPASSSINYC